MGYGTVETTEAVTINFIGGEKLAMVTSRSIDVRDNDRGWTGGGADMSATVIHRGWSGASLSDDDLVKEGVRRDDQGANLMDQSMGDGGIGIHNQLGILPTANILKELAGFGGNNAR